MGRLVLRSSIVSVGGGGDLLTPRDPTGSDLFANLDAGSDGSGTEGSPWNVLSNARMQSIAESQQLVISGNGAFPDCTNQVEVATAGTRIVVRAHPSAPGSGFTFSGYGSRLGGATYWDFYELALQCADGFGMCTGERDDFNGGLLGNYNRWIRCVGTKSGEYGGSINAGTGIIYCTSGASYGQEVILCTLSGIGGGGGPSLNCALLFFDNARFLNVLGNSFTGCQTLLYFKHTDVLNPALPGGTVQNNIFLDYLSRMSLNYVTYRNNAFDTSHMQMDEAGGGLDYSQNCALEHNTYFNSDWLAAQGLSGAGTQNNTARNNVMAGTSRYFNAPASASDANNDIDYSAVSGTGTNHYYRNSTQRTMASYKSTYATQEVNGLAGTLDLVGGSNPGLTPGNFALAPGSVGIGNASDGGDRGVDATKLLTIN